MEIVWSSLAVEQLADVLEYVEESFGTSVARKTYQRITEKVAQLMNYPQIGVFDAGLSSLIEGVEVRHLILAPNVLYYLIDNNEIVIMAVVHSKQSPEFIRKRVLSFLEQYQ